LQFGEIRGGEAFDLLQLLNTAHSGTISTVHANSAAQGISRFTTCVMQSGVEIPYRAITTNIADSLNLIVQLDRRPGLVLYQRFWKFGASIPKQTTMISLASTIEPQKYNSNCHRALFWQTR